MYINTKTKQYPLTERDIRASHPNTLFPSPFSPPAHYALVEPTPMPESNPAFQAVSEGEPKKKGSRWVRTWIVSDLPLEQQQDIKEENDQRMVDEYLSELENFYDKKAKEKRYDNRISCALRSGYPGPYQPEGIAFAEWMDACNESAYQILDAVVAGDQERPSIEDFIGNMPALVWPN